MKLKILSSGSHGNCYLLESDKEILILECGIPIKDIKIGLDFDLSKVVGAIVTHKHADHAKSVSDLRKMGYPVFTPYSNLEPMRIGNEFKIQAFELTTLDGRWTHTDADGSECPCYGFLITHPEMGKMLYITDTEFVKWRFKNINHILLGVNYDSTFVVQNNIAKNTHVLKGHMSIDTACDFVKANHSDNLKNVIMCHLSNENADKLNFIDKMRKVACEANVYVVEPMLEIELRKKGDCPF